MTFAFALIASNLLLSGAQAFPPLIGLMKTRSSSLVLLNESGFEWF